MGLLNVVKSTNYHNKHSCEPHINNNTSQKGRSEKIAFFVEFDIKFSKLSSKLPELDVPEIFNCNEWLNIIEMSKKLIVELNIND